MKLRFTARLQRWLMVLSMVALCALVFEAWLAPKNVASWLMLASFCT